MSGLSLSVRVDSGVIGHNNRDFIAKNVNAELVNNNIVYKNEDLREVYQKLFSQALDEYNASKTKTRDKIADYYEHMCKSKQEKPFYEAVIQFGNQEDCPVGTENGDKAQAMLDRYMKEFQNRNPHLYVFNAVMHNDEATPHLHIDFVPVATEQTRGLSTRVSLKSALHQQNIVGKSAKSTDRQQWAVIEKKIMTDIAHSFGFEIEHKGIHRPHLEVDEYKKAMADLEILKERLSEIQNDNAENLSPQDISLLKSQIRFLQGELQISQAPAIEFKIPNEEKLSAVKEKLDERKIRYTETENGITAPETAAQVIQNEVRDFKPSAQYQSHRDKLKLDIDTQIYYSNSLDSLLKNLQNIGYEIKHRGANISVRPPEGKRFLRLYSLGDDYTETALKKRIENRDKYFEGCQKKVTQTAGMERDFHVTSAQIMILFYKKQIQAEPFNTHKPYSFKNDARINKVVNAARLVESEHLSADNIGTKIESLADRNIELFKLIHNAKVQNAPNLKELQSELQANKRKLESFTRIDEMAKEIRAGNYIDKLIADERERQKEHEYENEYEVNSPAD